MHALTEGLTGYRECGRMIFRGHFGTPVTAPVAQQAAESGRWEPHL